MSTLLKKSNAFYEVRSDPSDKEMLRKTESHGHVIVALQDVHNMLKPFVVACLYATDLETLNISTMNRGSLGTASAPVGSTYDVLEIEEPHEDWMTLQRRSYQRAARKLSQYWKSRR